MTDDEAEHGFQHEALLFSGDDELLAGVVPFVADGVAAGEPVLVALPLDHLDGVRSALGSDAARVGWVDMEELGTNPARIIPAWSDFLEQHQRSSGPVRGVGEPIWAGRGEAELVECQLHEALLNVAFSNTGPFTLLCPYDIDSLPRSVIEEARRSHAGLRQDGHRRHSRSCAHMADMTEPFRRPLPAAPPVATRLHFSAANLHEVRQLVTDLSSEILDERRTLDHSAAVHEIAANSVIHGGGRGTALAWYAGRSAVVEIRDGGHIADPLVGRRRPDRTRVSGRGVWLANQLCDLVQVRSGAGGTTVRLHQHAA